MGAVRSDKSVEEWVGPVANVLDGHEEDGAVALSFRADHPGCWAVVRRGGTNPREAPFSARRLGVGPAHGALPTTDDVAPRRFGLGPHDIGIRAARDGQVESRHAMGPRDLVGPAGQHDRGGDPETRRPMDSKSGVVHRLVAWSAGDPTRRFGEPMNPTANGDVARKRQPYTPSIRPASSQNRRGNPGHSGDCGNRGGPRGPKLTLTPLGRIGKDAPYVFLGPSWAMTRCPPARWMRRGWSLGLPRTNHGAGATLATRQGDFS